METRQDEFQKTLDIFIIKMSDRISKYNDKSTEENHTIIVENRYENQKNPLTQINSVKNYLVQSTEDKSYAGLEKINNEGIFYPKNGSQIQRNKVADDEDSYIYYPIEFDCQEIFKLVEHNKNICDNQI